VTNGKAPKSASKPNLASTTNSLSLSDSKIFVGQTQTKTTSTLGKRGVVTKNRLANILQQTIRSLTDLAFQTMKTDFLTVGVGKE